MKFNPLLSQHQSLFLLLFILVASLGFSTTTFAAKSAQELKSLFQKEYKDKAKRAKLKEETFALSSKAVPVLIEVMKTSSYPDDNRWMATFLLGQIMGDNAAPFIAKFAKHPKWFMRMASLKTLLLLKKVEYKNIYAKALQDPSMIVRAQALDNIIQMELNKLAPSVWSMIYDESNYAGGKANLKRTQMIKDIIMAMGHLDFKKSKPALLKMMNNSKYSDLVSELDYSLKKLTGKTSPKHSGAKKIFWRQYAVSEKLIF